MKKLCAAIITISLLFGGIIYAAPNTNTVLKNIWDSRSDLQIVFPDGAYHYDWSLEEWAREYGWKENHHLKQFNPEYEKDYIYKKYLPLERALDEIASKRYDYDNYFCVQFTNDLEAKLIENDIASIKIVGTEPKSNEQGNHHEWIAIMLEPKNGKIIRISENYEVLKIEK